MLGSEVSSPPKNQFSSNSSSNPSLFNKMEIVSDCASQDEHSCQISPAGDAPLPSSGDLKVSDSSSSATSTVKDTRPSRPRPSMESLRDAQKVIPSGSYSIKLSTAPATPTAVATVLPPPTSHMEVTPSPREDTSSAEDVVMAPAEVNATVNGVDLIDPVAVASAALIALVRSSCTASVPMPAHEILRLISTNVCKLLHLPPPTPIISVYTSAQKSLVLPSGSGPAKSFVEAVTSFGPKRPHPPARQRAKLIDIPIEKLQSYCKPATSPSRSLGDWRYVYVKGFHAPKDSPHRAIVQLLEKQYGYASDNVLNVWPVGDGIHELLIEKASLPLLLECLADSSLLVSTSFSARAPIAGQSKDAAVEHFNRRIDTILTRMRAAPRTAHMRRLIDCFETFKAVDNNCPVLPATPLSAFDMAYALEKSHSGRGGSF